MQLSLILVFVFFAAIAVLGIVIVVMNVRSHRPQQGIRTWVKESAETFREDAPEPVRVHPTHLDALLDEAYERQYKDVMSTVDVSKLPDTPDAPGERDATIIPGDQGPVHYDFEEYGQVDTIPSEQGDIQEAQSNAQEARAVLPSFEPRQKRQRPKVSELVLARRHSDNSEESANPHTHIDAEQLSNRKVDSDNDSRTHPGEGIPADNIEHADASDDKGSTNDDADQVEENHDDEPGANDTDQMNESSKTVQSVDTDHDDPSYSTEDEPDSDEDKATPSQEDDSSHEDAPFEEESSSQENDDDKQPLMPRPPVAGQLLLAAPGTAPASPPAAPTDKDIERLKEQMDEHHESSTD
ncbi:MAG: hypothetical protein Q4P66_04430 [Actinomycetaceae bacterium]|nr:hypothetical protein [Actinomycetaceae bacterium]